MESLDVPLNLPLTATNRTLLLRKFLRDYLSILTVNSSIMVIKYRKKRKNDYFDCANFFFFSWVIL